MKKTRRIFVTVIGVSGLLFLMIIQTGFFSGKKIKPGRIEIKTGKIYDVYTVKETEEPVIYKAVGTIHSRDEVELSARITARIKEVKVRNGDKVKKGQVLIKLDDTDLKAAVDRAKSAVKTAEAALNAAIQAIKQREAALDFAKSEYERTKKLFVKKAIAKRIFDEADSNYRQALAALSSAKDNKKAAESRIQSAKDALKEAQTVLSYAEIICPMSGIVSERLADPGDLASPGIILMKIFDSTRVMLETPIRESLVRRVKIGDTIPFYVGALNKNFKGIIKEIVPSVDPGSRTFIVRICIGKNPELFPGMYGVISLPLGKKKLILLSEKYIERVGQLEYVHMLTDDNRIIKTFIRTAEYPSDKRKKIVISGLTSGMKILPVSLGNS